MVLSFICKEREPINIDIGSEKKKANRVHC